MPVDINDPDTVKRICNQTGCTEDDLRKTVQKVGTSESAVIAELNNIVLIRKANKCL
jgi:Protein of unknown function (DUF3606).